MTIIATKAGEYTLANHDPRAFAYHALIQASMQLGARAWRRQHACWIAKGRLGRFEFVPPPIRYLTDAAASVLSGHLAPEDGLRLAKQALEGP